MKKIILFTLLVSIFDFTKFLSVDEVFEPADSDKSFSEFKNILEKRINYLEKNENLNIEFFLKEKNLSKKTKITFTNFLRLEGTKLVAPNNESEKFYLYNNSEKNLLKYIDIIINSSILNNLDEDKKEGLKVDLKEKILACEKKIKVRAQYCYGIELENNQENFYFCLNFRNF